MPSPAAERGRDLLPQARPLRILGVDPGLTRCGIGVIDMHPNRRAELVAVGVVGTDPSTPLEQRLLAIDKGINAWMDEHKPDLFALERVFASSNVSTVMGTSQASGVAIVAAARRSIPVALHTPSEVKAAVTGSGQADKQAVTSMVMRILRLQVAPKPADAADALALAIAAGWRRGVSSVEGSNITGGGRSRIPQAAPAAQMTPAQKAWAQAAKSRGSGGSKRGWG